MTDGLGGSGGEDAGEEGGGGEDREGGGGEAGGVAGQDEVAGALEGGLELEGVFDVGDGVFQDRGYMVREGREEGDDGGEVAEDPLLLGRAFCSGFGENAGREVEGKGKICIFKGLTTRL